MIKVQHVENVISTELCNFLSTQYEMMRDNLVNYAHAFQDPMGPGNFSWYAPLQFETLLEYLRPTIEKCTELNLHPTYSYARIYTNGAEMKKHTDRRSSEIAVTCCLKRDIDWPIYFEIDGEEYPINMNVGDICIYRGMEVPHWRNTYSGNNQVQAFLMYVDADGPYKYFKYDTRPRLAAPYESTHQIIKDEMAGIIKNPEEY